MMPANAIPSNEIVAAPSGTALSASWENGANLKPFSVFVILKDVVEMTWPFFLVTDPPSIVVVVVAMHLTTIH